jgi:myo-inositol-1-phosphate synthase
VKKMSKIKIAIVGIGNCASSLIQGIHYYKDKDPKDAIGLMH